MLRHEYFMLRREYFTLSPEYSTPSPEYFTPDAYLPSKKQNVIASGKLIFFSVARNAPGYKYVD